MRILIDECIDERLRNSFHGHDCQTARYAGLSGLKNGDLLTAAEVSAFDVFLTVDQGIEHQQNLTARKMRASYPFNLVRLSGSRVSSEFCATSPHVSPRILFRNLAGDLEYHPRRAALRDTAIVEC